MTSERPLIVLGAGNSARHVARTAEAAGFTVAGFTCSFRDAGTLVDRWQVLGRHEIFGTPEYSTGFQAAISVTDPLMRRDLFRMVAQSGVTLPSIVHPTCLLYDTVEIGPGAILHGMNVICYGSVLGPCVIMDPQSHVGNDNRVGGFCTFSPGARTASSVTLGDGVSLGINASILPDVEIGEGTVMGAGCTAVRSLPKDVIAAGVPARVLRSREPSYLSS